MPPSCASLSLFLFLSSISACNQSCIVYCVSAATMFLSYQSCYKSQRLVVFETIFCIPIPFSRPIPFRSNKQFSYWERLLFPILALNQLIRRYGFWYSLDTSIQFLSWWTNHIMSVVLSKPVERTDVSRVKKLFWTMNDIFQWELCVTSQVPSPSSPLGQHTLLELRSTLQYSFSYCIKTAKENTLTAQAGSWRRGQAKC